jgi:hypothetical protein
VLKELARMDKLKSLVDTAKEKQMNHKKEKVTPAQVDIFVGGV